MWKLKVTYQTVWGELEKNFLVLKPVYKLEQSYRRKADFQLAMLQKPLFPKAKVAVRYWPKNFFGY